MAVVKIENAKIAQHYTFICNMPAKTTKPETDTESIQPRTATADAPTEATSATQSTFIPTGQPSTQMTAATMNLKKLTEKQLGGVATAIGLGKKDSETWKSKLEEIAATQLRLLGIEPYIIPQAYASMGSRLEPLTPKPASWPSGVKVDSNGYKVRTTLDGRGIATSVA